MEKDSSTKDKIRIQAMKLFRQYGYDQVSVQKISDASGVSKNTFYYYYVSKEALIISLFDPSQVIDLERMVQLMSIADPYERLMEIIRRTAAYFTSMSQDVVRKLLVMNLSGTLTGKGHCSTTETRAFIKILEDTFQQAQSQSEIRTDQNYHELIQASVTMLVGCLQIWANREKEGNLTEMCRANMEMLLKNQKDDRNRKVRYTENVQEEKK